MNEQLIIQLSIAVLFLPLLGFIVTVFLGKRIKSIYIFELFIITLVFLGSAVIGYFKLFQFTDANFVSEFKWIETNVTPLLGNIGIDLGIQLDNISTLMLITVSIVSMLVHYYSVSYMKGDIRYNRYFAYLGLFTFSMFGIVLTHNILMMYIFWELVGVSSYLLIGFWYEKKISRRCR